MHRAHRVGARLPGRERAAPEPRRHGEAAGQGRRRARAPAGRHARSWTTWSAVPSRTRRGRGRELSGRARPRRGAACGRPDHGHGRARRRHGHGHRRHRHPERRLDRRRHASPPRSCTHAPRRATTVRGGVTAAPAATRPPRGRAPRARRPAGAVPRTAISAGRPAPRSGPSRPHQGRADGDLDRARRAVAAGARARRAHVRRAAPRPGARARPRAAPRRRGGARAHAAARGARAARCDGGIGRLPLL